MLKVIVSGALALTSLLARAQDLSLKNEVKTHEVALMYYAHKRADELSKFEKAAGAIGLYHNNVWRSEELSAKSKLLDSLQAYTDELIIASQDPEIAKMEKESDFGPVLNVRYKDTFMGVSSTSTFEVQYKPLFGDYDFTSSIVLDGAFQSIPVEAFENQERAACSLAFHVDRNFVDENLRRFYAFGAGLDVKKPLSARTLGGCLSAALDEYRDFTRKGGRVYNNMIEILFARKLGREAGAQAGKMLVRRVVLTPKTSDPVLLEAFKKAVLEQ
jgi:hypothetical protein